MVLKETLAYYVVDGGSAFCTFLDAIKAFDRIDYCKLELCADELMVGGGVGWCYDRRRRRAANFSSAAAAAAAWLCGRRRRRQTG